MAVSPSSSSSVVEPAERLRVGADEVTMHVASAASRGALLAIEVRMAPGGGPPALHRHDPDEVYRLERGALAIYLEDEGGDVRRIAVTPGMVVHIPGGREHTVRNESDAEALAYVVFAPGTEMERFIRAAEALAAAGPPRPQDVLALAERHGIEMTGPLPGAQG
jgi:mannose-6-phosphate isomerase-like protein (cupin superfamily)